MPHANACAHIYFHTDSSHWLTLQWCALHCMAGKQILTPGLQHQNISLYEACHARAAGRLEFYMSLSAKRVSLTVFHADLSKFGMCCNLPACWTQVTKPWML